MSDSNTEIRRSRYIIDKIIIWFKTHRRLRALSSTLLIFLIVKSFVLMLIVFSFEQLGHSIGGINETIQTGDTLFDLLGTRWDSWFYLVIAQNGEYLDHLRPTDTRVWNFAPLYPLFTRIFMDIGKIFHLQIHVTIAGVLVANFFSITSIIAFFYMSCLYLDEIKSSFATLMFAFFPTVFAFSTVAYAEPVFITFTILSWYFFEKQHYKTSGFTLGLASLARYPGALIFFLYIPIYFFRRVKEKGLKISLGSLAAIPLFPILVLIHAFFALIRLVKTRTWGSDMIEKFTSKTFISKKKITQIKETLEFLDIGLSWVLIFGLMPSIWILYVNSTAPMTLSEITYLHWDAKFVFPFTGFFDMLEGGNIKWTLEKYIFALFFLGVGLITLTKRPSFSLLIIAQTLFYTGYVGIHAWGVPRYTGTIFLGTLVLAEELNSVKVMMLMTSLFLTYGFIVLWEFVNWQIWLI